MKVQLGGGTNIAKAVEYGRQLIEQPGKSVIILVSDFYEGGTSSLLIHQIKQCVRRSVEICQFTQQTRYLCAIPAAHNYAMSSPGALGVFLAGGTVVLAADPSATLCFPLIAKHQVNVTALVPPAVTNRSGIPGGYAFRQPDCDGSRFRLSE